METQFGFTKYSVVEFENWIASISVARTITKIQEHHTWQPNYDSFSGTNHFILQKGMKDYHVDHNGWADIGQHFSIFPDGSILTGRPLNNSPACIYGANSNAICIENVGNFDVGEDAMLPVHQDAIVRATAAIARRFGLLPVTTNNIVYHHWFDLNTGERTDGAGTTKTCPGTAFFGGNSVAACQQNFLPLLQGVLGATAAPVPIPQYGRVVADSLNVRSGPSSTSPIADGQAPLQAGAIVRIFTEAAHWLKIANTKEHWVSGRHVRPSTRRIVNTDNAKVRAGPAAGFPVLATVKRGDEVFIDEERLGWARTGVGETWIRRTLID